MAAKREEQLTAKDEKGLINIGHPAYYNNRELSWLAFNRRVLEEAHDDRNPLLERLKFLSIFSSNLDEFFMVRVAGLKDQVKAGFNQPENKAGMTPKEQLAAISDAAYDLVNMQDETFNDYISPALRQEGINIVSVDELSKKQYAYIEQIFEDEIFSVLTPLAIDAYRPFPKLANRSLNLAVSLIDQKDKTQSFLAIVQVPNVLNRFIRLPSLPDIHCYILLEDVISCFIQSLFLGYKVKSVSMFRIIRNADLTIHEEGAQDLLKVIEKELKKRQWGAAIRLEVRKDQMAEGLLKFLQYALDVEDKEIYVMQSPLDLSFMSDFYNELKQEYEYLTFPSLFPQPPEELLGKEDIYEVMREEDIMLHHPYESFQPVVDFMSAVADDPHVLAIKQTLYRVSEHSPICEALIRAAEQGKQVTVLMELKARFDEQNNIHWAKRLEKVGAHVIYGSTGLKTHSKITLVVRKEGNIIERFVHLGTGNYNEITAKLYTDIGYFTTDKQFAQDATNFFNYLSGYRTKPNWNRFTTSPYGIRDGLIADISREISLHEKNGNGHMIAKMNSLTDKKIIMKLYEASRAGVRIDLIVRGICCLKPGIPGVSENITVRSIVGRFLEHTRIFYFHHNGEENIMVSSADWMTRNMERRIEIAFPILATYAKQRIVQMLHIMLADNMKAREQDQHGHYYYVQQEETREPINSQLSFFKMAYEAAEKEFQKSGMD